MPQIVTITLLKDGDYCVLTVADKGKGIQTKDFRKSLICMAGCTRILKAAASDCTLQKKILNAANVNIVVETKPGKGTKFIIYLNQDVIPTAFCNTEICIASKSEMARTEWRQHWML